MKKRGNRNLRKSTKSEARLAAGGVRAFKHRERKKRKKKEMDEQISVLTEKDWWLPQAGKELIAAETD